MDDDQIRERAKQRMAELRKRANERIAAAEFADYADDPEALAEQEAITKAFWPLQVEAMKLAERDL